MENSLGFIVICLILGAITAYIAQKKNLGNVGGWFLFGALLFIVALIVEVLAKPGLPQAPPGMRAVKCPRCNTVQNVPEKQRTYECWQCKASHELWAAPATKTPTLKSVKSAVQTTKVRCHACQAVQSVPVNQATFVCEQCGMKLKRKPKQAS